MEDEIRNWFAGKYDVDSERLDIKEHSGNDVCYFIHEYLKDKEVEFI